MSRLVVAVGATGDDAARLAADLGAHLPGANAEELLHQLMVRSPVVLPDDARPGVPALADQRLEDDELVAWASRWVAAELARGPLLLDDPRALWFHSTWRAAARAGGAELAFVTVLRHPVDVARASAAVDPADPEQQRRSDVGVVAAWCNVHLSAEALSRDDPRSYVRGEAAPTAGEPRPVDIPDGLGAVGDGLAARLDHLVEHPDDPETLAAIDTLRADYARLHDDAVGLARTHTRGREVHVRRTTRANLAREYRERVDELEAQLAEANDGATTDRHRFPR